jgi:hypothetical protein
MKPLHVCINRDHGRFGFTLSGSQDWREVLFGATYRSNFNRNTCTEDGKIVGTHHILVVAFLWWRVTLSVLI